jgi:hypothetical protein
VEFLVGFYRILTPSMLYILIVAEGRTPTQNSIPLPSPTFQTLNTVNYIKFK